MFTLYRTTIARLTWGQQYLNLAFFRQVQERLRERLCLIVARRDGEVIAGTLNVVKGDASTGATGARRPTCVTCTSTCATTRPSSTACGTVSRASSRARGEFKLLRGFDATATESMHLIRDPRLADAVRRYLRDERRAVASEIEWLGERTARKRWCARRRMTSASREGVGHGGQDGSEALHPTQERLFNLVTKPFSRINTWLYRLSGGRIGGRWTHGEPIMLLSYTGRKSGERRTTPLVFLRDGDALVIVASKGGTSKNPCGS
jgi:hypothetical protein